VSRAGPSRRREEILWLTHQRPALFSSRIKSHRELPPVKSEGQRMQSLFSKIETTEQAEKVIREVSILLYGLAALNFLFFVVYLGKPVYLTDVGFLVLAGLILRGSRSRCVAAVVAAYALFVGTLTVLARAGIYEGDGGRNVVLAVIVAFAAVRGVNATVIYHRNHGTKANPRGALALTAIAAVLSALAFVAVVLIAPTAGFDLENDADSDVVGGWSIPALAAPWVLVFGRVVPFVRRIRVTKTANENKARDSSSSGS
jgi:hypothetical protein